MNHSLRYCVNLCVALVTLLFVSVPMYAQDGSIPALRERLRENYTQQDFDEFLRKERNGELPSQMGRVASQGTSDVLVNNNTGSTGTTRFTQSETTILAYGEYVIVGFNDSGSSTGGANKFTGWSYSTDGGSTFTDGGTLPTNTGGDAGDPVLARNETTGRIYYSTLQFTGSGMPIFRSDDNAVTWMAPVQGAPGKTGFQDKQWIAVDNFPGSGNGNVYLVVRDFGAGNGIYFFKSTDNGDTFGPSGGTLIAAGGGTNVQGAFVAVGTDHSVNAFYFDENSIPERIMMRRSTDLGATFGAPVAVTTLGTSIGFNGDLALTGTRHGDVSASGFRSNTFPHAAINPVSGHLYVTYADNPAGADKADVFFVQSTDGGTTWSSPLRVNDDATTTDQWMPTIAVTPDGSSLGIFYDSREIDVTNNNFFKHYGRLGTISGSSVVFDPSFAVSDVGSGPEFGRDGVVNSLYMGDYNHAVATSSAFHVVWSDNRTSLAGGDDRMDPNVYYKTVPLTPAPIVSDAPVVNSPIPSGSTSVSGTSTEADGTVIDVFVNSLSVGTTTVSGGTWTKGGLLSIGVGLLVGDTVKATATASGETTSPFSNEVVVKDVTTAPVVNSPIVSGSTIVTGTSTEANGTLINVFVNSLFVGSANVTGGTWLWDQSDLLGNSASAKTALVGLLVGDTVKATATASGELPSSFSNEVIVMDVTTAPVVNSPIAAGATSVSGTGPESIVSPKGKRALGGTTIEVFVNSVSVGGATVDAGGTWTKIGLAALSAGDSVKAKATAIDKITSVFSNVVIVKNVTVAPVVTSPIAAGATSVSGTGPETNITPDGRRMKGDPDPVAATIIEVFKNSISVGTTIVNAGGSWTKSGLGALAAGDSVKAKATAYDKLTSPFSNEVIVSSANCDITSVSFENVGSCNNSGTGDPADDYFTADVVVNFVNAPATGNLQIEPGGDAIGTYSVAVGSLVGNSHTFSGVQFKADGTPTVAEVEFTEPANSCVQTQVGPTVNSCSSCDITSVSFENVGSCNNSGTGDPTDDYFTADVVVNFVNPPATGNLQIEPGGDAIGTYSVAVGSLVGNSHTFSGVQFKADGTPTVAEVEFTEPASLCVQTQVGPTVNSCSSNPNVVVNPDFESGTSPWVFFTNGTGNYVVVPPGASGSGNAARLTNTTSGSNTQFYQSGITLVPNTEYTLTFKARSTASHDLSVFVHRHEAPYTNYGLNGPVFNLTNAWQTFTTTFTSINFPPPTPSNARLRFRLNGFAANGEQYFIDDVTLIATGSALVATKINVETAPDGGGSVVPAQTIENGDAITMYAISRTASNQFVANVSATWGLLNPTGGVVIGDLAVSGDFKSAVFTGGADGTTQVQATSGGLTPTPTEVITVFTPPPVTNLLVNGGFESGTANWNFNTNGAGTFSAITPGTVGAKAGQVSITTAGTSVQLYQFGISLTSGESYRLSFKAFSTTGHDVQGSVFKHASPFTPYGLTGHVFNLTNAWASYSVDFVASGFAGTVNDARLRFWLAPYDANGDVYQFDDVKLELLPAPSLAGTPSVAAIPESFGLEQNFPNPFNPSTTIIYTLPVDARVRLDVIDMLGQKVATLMDGVVTAGYHDAVFDAGSLASGMYFYRLHAVGTDGTIHTKTEKMLLTK